MVWVKTAACPFIDTQDERGLHKLLMVGGEGSKGHNTSSVLHVQMSKLKREVSNDHKETFFSKKWGCTTASKPSFIVSIVHNLMKLIYIREEGINYRPQSAQGPCI